MACSYRTASASACKLQRQHLATHSSRVLTAAEAFVLSHASTLPHQHTQLYAVRLYTASEALQRHRQCSTYSFIDNDGSEGAASTAVARQQLQCVSIVVSQQQRLRISTAYNSSVCVSASASWTTTTAEAQLQQQQHSLQRQPTLQQLQHHRYNLYSRDYAIALAAASAIVTSATAPQQQSSAIIRSTCATAAAATFRPKAFSLQILQRLRQQCSFYSPFSNSSSSMAPAAIRPDFNNCSFSSSSCNSIATSAVPDAVLSAKPTSSPFSDLSIAASSLSFSVPATA